MNKQTFVRIEKRLPWDDFQAVTNSSKRGSINWFKKIPYFLQSKQQMILPNNNSSFSKHSIDAGSAIIHFDDILILTYKTKTKQSPLFGKNHQLWSPHFKTTFVFQPFLKTEKFSKTFPSSKETIILFIKTSFVKRKLCYENQLRLVECRNQSKIGGINFWSATSVWVFWHFHPTFPWLEN